MFAWSPACSYPGLSPGPAPLVREVQVKILQSYRQMLAGIVVLACTAAQSPCAGETSANRSAPAARGATVASVIPFTGVVPFVVGDPTLVSAEWRQGTGCPTNLPVPFACFSASDPTDNVNAGLILSKSGPTTSDPAVDLSLYPAGIDTDLPPYAAAELQGVAGARVADLAELGYDLRKFFMPLNQAGSHCGLRAPRFDVVTQGMAGPPSTHFFYCLSGVVENINLAWIRMRWMPDQAVPPMDPADTIQSIKIVFDEGVDPAGGLPDLFGLAVLDNIDVNGILVGNAQPANQFPDEDDGQGERPEVRCLERRALHSPRQLQLRQLCRRWNAERQARIRGQLPDLRPFGPAEDCDRQLLDHHHGAGGLPLPEDRNLEEGEGESSRHVEPNFQSK